MSGISQAGLGRGGKPEGGRREEAGEERRLSQSGGISWQKIPGREDFGAQDGMKCPHGSGTQDPGGRLGGGETTWEGHVAPA